MKRKIIRIDQARCNGCGLCLPNCKEGALQIIKGKALLVSDSACDGLGACLGHCPQDAITIEEREAQPFDEKTTIIRPQPFKCPGSKAMVFSRENRRSGLSQTDSSEISNWPIQLRLAPVNASYFNGADLLISADCVPFAYPNFHQEFLQGKILLVGCPKLDDLDLYRDKLNQILKTNQVLSVTYVYMEVPCCLGLLGIIKEAITASTKDIPFKQIMISVKGEKVL
jgi:NAD-dependent dihydropyrimidine dehydrogenase PreA subunit